MGMDKEIEEALRRAWLALITEHDNTLVAMLDEKVADLCGHKVGRDRTRHFILNLRPGNRKQTRPKSFTFCGRMYEAKTWGKVLKTLAEEIYKRHPSDFSERVAGLYGWYHPKTGPRFPDKPPEPISDSGWYVYTILSGEATRTKCYQLLYVFGYREQHLQIEWA